MSTIFADKFKNTSGGNPVQINQLRGIDTAGSITVQGEGTATTNLQQGLCKSWVNFDGTASGAARGSFNNSSMTDNTTGDFTVNMTNGVDSTNNIVASGSCNDDDSNNKHHATLCIIRSASGGSPFTTTTVRITTAHDGNTTSLRDMDFSVVSIHGDLA